MIKLVVAVLGVACIATPATAQTSDWMLDGMIGVVSDYRFRGYSLSDEGPALQSGLTASHRSGLYGDVFVSTIDEYGVGSDGDGAKFEITGTVGWAGKVGGFDVDVAAAAYHYPDGDGVNYVEFPIQIGQTHDALGWSAGVSFAPSQSALGDENNRYLWASLIYAPTAWPVSVSASAGLEDGAFAPDGKTDWSIGLAREWGRLGLGLMWVDSDADQGQAVVSAFVNF